MPERQASNFDRLHAARLTHVDGDCNWPVNPPGVGMGPFTSWKLDEYGAIARSNVSTVRNIFVNRQRRGLVSGRYIGLDLTAACGAYVWQGPNEPATHLRGTALLLLTVCERVHRESGLTYRLGLIEHAPNLVTMLQQRLAEGAARTNLDLSRVDVLMGDHSKLAVPWVLEHVPERRQEPTWGLITMDTNGEPGYEALRALGKMTRLGMVDYALHIGAAVPKWRRGKGAIPLEDQLAACNKKSWFIGRTRANWQWVWFVGTDWAPWAESLKRAGLVPKDSPEGKARWDTLCLTAKERQARDQRTLFDDQI